MKIALIGRSGAGKSTVAAILADRYNLSHLKTGTLCRQIATLLLGSDGKDETQRIDDALTTIDPSIFLRATLRNNVGVLDNCIIDSLRFTSDYVEARSNGFQIWRVCSPGSTRTRRLEARGQAFSKMSMGHRSETELDDVEAHISLQNNGDLDALRHSIEQSIQNIE